MYRTYAVSGIRRLLAETAELTVRSQKRYDDTALLLDTVVEHGFDSDPGRTPIRRINRLHNSFDISNDDMRYVLYTFVVTPKRWLDAYGCRRLSDHEMRVCAAYYRTLGAHVGIKDLPQTYEDVEHTLEGIPGRLRGGRARNVSRTGPRCPAPHHRRPDVQAR